MEGNAGDFPTYTVEDIAIHNTPEDCWLIIDGGVYDVSSFVRLHPGGDMIFVRAGGDCSDLFASYHPLQIRCVPKLSFTSCFENIYGSACGHWQSREGFCAVFPEISNQRRGLQGAAAQVSNRDIECRRSCNASFARVRERLEGRKVLLRFEEAC